MKPKRIQRQRTKGWRMPPNTVSVARPSKFGNPLKLTLYTRQKAVELFEKHLTDRAKKIIKKELKGKNLACFCKPYELCHADILLEIAND